MALDPSIPLGIKPVQIESPLNQMAKMYEMQNIVQSNKLNQMKMDEYARGVAKSERFNNALAQAKNEEDVKNAFISVGDIKGYQDYLKGTAEQAKLSAETTNLGYTGKKTQGEIAKQRQDYDNQAKRNLSFNSSNENVIAWGQDAVLSGVYTKEEVDRVTAQLLAMPLPERQAFLAGQGATAGDISTAATAKAGQAITMRGQDITNKRELEKIALDKQRLGLEERRVKVAETTGAPGYVKPLNATQQYKLDKLKAADKTNAKLFDASIDAELKNIDKLIGSETAPKLHKGLANATGPITSRLPTGRIDTANAEAYIKSLQSKASINSLQSIRGTAGAIGTMTEREWPRLESMKATLQETQGTDQFIQSLKDYRAELKNMKLKSKEALNTDYSTEIGANIPSANPNIDALLQKYPE